jgi:hypothetical protein
MCNRTNGKGCFSCAAALELCGLRQEKFVPRTAVGNVVQAVRPSNNNNFQDFCLPDPFVLNFS